MRTAKINLVQAGHALLLSASAKAKAKERDKSTTSTNVTAEERSLAIMSTDEESKKS